MSSQQIATIPNAVFAFRCLQIILTIVFLPCHIALTVDNPYHAALRYIEFGYFAGFGTLILGGYAVCTYARKDHLTVQRPRYYFLWSGVDLVLLFLWIWTILATYPGVGDSIFAVDRSIALRSRTITANISEFFLNLAFLTTATLLNIQGFRRRSETRTVKEVFEAKQLEEGIRERTLEEAKRKKTLQEVFEGKDMKELP